MPRAVFSLDDPMRRNVVNVVSRAPLETILVRSNEISGEIELDTDNVLDRPRVAFEVPTASLDTGIPLMNEVLRSDRWLDATKFPAIRFELTKFASPTTSTALKDGVTMAVDAEGTCSLHGVSRPVTVHGEVVWFKANDNIARRLPGDVLRLRARFDVPLPAFGIEAHLSPQTLGKVEGTLNVEVDVFASTARPQVPEQMLQNLARARRDLGQRLVGA